MGVLRILPLEVLVLLVVGSLVTAALTAAAAVRRGEPAGAVVRGARVLLVGAVLAVLAVTLLQGSGGSRVNLVPGAGIVAALDAEDRSRGLVNLAGNVVMFVPIGLLLPLATRWRRWRRLRTIGACATLSVVVEALQLAAGRAVDIDDVLLNTAGGALGAVLGVHTALLIAVQLDGSHGERGARTPGPREQPEDQK